MQQKNQVTLCCTTFDIPKSMTKLRTHTHIELHTGSLLCSQGFSFSYFKTSANRQTHSLNLPYPSIKDRSNVGMQEMRSVSQDGRKFPFRSGTQQTVHFPNSVSTAEFWIAPRTHPPIY
uniref:Uncharacterized protein n=1 Tax=Sphaerodactylus townsendi TaxID=933632 RepID=A0ACB8FMN6_9SAUR